MTLSVNFVEYLKKEYQSFTQGYRRALHDDKGFSSPKGHNSLECVWTENQNTQGKKW